MKLGRELDEFAQKPYHMPRSLRLPPADVGHITHITTKVNPLGTFDGAVTEAFLPCRDRYRFPDRCSEKRLVTPPNTSVWGKSPKSRSPRRVDWGACGGASRDWMRQTGQAKAARVA